MDITNHVRTLNRIFRDEFDHDLQDVIYSHTNKENPPGVRGEYVVAAPSPAQHVAHDGILDTFESVQVLPNLYSMCLFRGGYALTEEQAIFVVGSYDQTDSRDDGVFEYELHCYTGPDKQKWIDATYKTLHEGHATALLAKAVEEYVARTADMLDKSLRDVAKPVIAKLRAAVQADEDFNVQNKLKPEIIYAAKTDEIPPIRPQGLATFQPLDLVEELLRAPREQD